jgi:hypothetical protein
MTEEEYNARIARVYEALQPVETYVPPEPQPGWTPRHVERRAPEPEPEPERRPRAAAPGGVVIYERIDRAWQHHQNLRHFVENGLMTDVLGPETGAAMGAIRKELRDEFKAQLAKRDKQINEMRGEIALLRALQPKRLLPRKSVTQIEGSLVGHPVVN